MSSGSVILDSAYTPELVAKVEALIAQGNTTGARVQAWEDIQVVLLDHQLLWRGHYLPEHVGVHPQNRSSLGVGGSEAHHNGAQVLKAGWSWSKCADVVGIEAPLPPHNQEAIAANEQYVALSDGFIPPLQTLRLLRVGGGHTNTFLKAMKACSRSAVASIADASGHLNKEEIFMNRPSFKDALDKGLK